MSTATMKRLPSNLAQAHQGTTVPRTRWAIAGLILSLSVGLLINDKAEANTFRFKKIADTSTSIPGGTGNFTSFAPPALEKGNVAFRGSSATFGQSGIYTTLGGTLNVVADTNTLIPNTTDRFSTTYYGGFTNPSLDKETVTFGGVAGRAFTAGVFTYANGSLQTLVPSNAPYSLGPNTGTGGGPFLRILSVSSDNGNIAFRSETSSPGAGLYTGVFTDVNGSLRVYARYYDRGLCSSTLTRPVRLDGLDSPVELYALGSPVVNNGMAAFNGNYCTSNGERRIEAIQKTDGGSLQTVAVGSVTPIPGGSGNFTGFGSPALDNGIIAFRGTGTDQVGIYTNTDQGLQLVADLNTPIPEGTGTFASFGDPALDDGNLVFVGSDLNGQAGLYTTLGGELTKIIASNDALDGKIVKSVAIGKEALSRKRIAFQVEFTDGSQGIYVGMAKLRGKNAVDE